MKQWLLVKNLEYKYLNMIILQIDKKYIAQRLRSYTRQYHDK